MNLIWADEGVEYRKLLTLDTIMINNDSFH